MNAFTVEVWTLYAVSVLVIFIRIFARWKMVGIKQFQADDYLMLLAAVIYGCETTAGYSVGALYHGLANNNLTDEQRAAIVPKSDEWNRRVGGSKVQIIGWSLWTGVLWILKFCMITFYSRLTNGLFTVRHRIRIAYFLIGGSFMVVLSAILLGCRPFHKNWQINPDPGAYCYPAVTPINNFTAFTMNVSTDIYLMSIPLPLLWRSSLSPKKKALMISMFGGGVFIIMCSIFRVYLLVVAPVTGAQAAGIWGCRETFVAIVIGNVPMIYPYCIHMFRKAQGAVTSSYTFSCSGGSGAGIELRGASRPMRRKENPLSLPGLTTLEAGESEEHINKTPPGKEEQAVGISVVTEVSSTSYREGRSPTYSHGSDGSKPYEQPHEYRPSSAPKYTVKVVGGECIDNLPQLKGDETWTSKRSG